MDEKGNRYRKKALEKYSGAGRKKDTFGVNYPKILTIIGEALKNFSPQSASKICKQENQKKIERNVIVVAGVKEHYENLLAPYYSWICGGSDANFKANRAFFHEHGVRPVRSGVAVDLGAGTGFQSIPLAESGFQVIAIDLNHELLAQLKKDAKNMPIVTIQDNLVNFSKHTPSRVEIIVCMGDTLTHLDSLEEVRGLIETVHQALEQGGLFVLGFRDMTIELAELDRFIPVRSDPTKIFTCFLEFEKNHVKVHDIIYEKTNDHWNMKKSFFRKLRISEQWTKECLQKAGFRVESHGMKNGMVTLLACQR